MFSSELKAINLVHRCNSKFKMRNDIKANLKLNISINMTRRTIREILQILDAGYEGQFKRLRYYAEECLNSNPCSIVVIKTNRVVPDAPCIFQRIYVCFAALEI